MDADIFLDRACRTSLGRSGWDQRIYFE